MTEFKRNNKRSFETTEKKSAVKIFKTVADPDKTVKNIKDGKPKFEKKKFEKFSRASGKFQPAEKTNWSELKQKKKDLKIQRKKNKTKDLYDIDIKAKKIYEELKM